MSKDDKSCSDHPDAPHGFNRNASHNAGRYVCDCESWSPPTLVERLQTVEESLNEVGECHKYLEEK